MSLVLGVGSGVAGTVVEVRDAHSGRLVASGAASHPALVGGSQHPEVWWDGMVDAVGAAGLRHEVDGMAVAGQRQALVLLDGAGAPIGPASLRTDAGATATAAALTARLGAAKLARSTGQVPGPDTPLTRLAWLVGDDDALAARAAMVLGATELLTLRLTGRFVADRGSASGTGWWSPVRERWVTELLDRAVRAAPTAGWAACLADVAAPATVADRVRATVHEVVGLRGRPVVAAGTDDLMARALAAAAPPGTTALLLDDDAAAVVVADEPTIDTDGMVRSFAAATGQHLPTVPALAPGPVLDAAARLLGTDAHGLAALAAAAPTRDPVDAPVVVGFRTGNPGGRPATRPGAVLGLRADHGPGDLARAALHGVAADLLAAAARAGGARDAPLLLAGPQAAAPGLAQAVADLAGTGVILGPAAQPATGACLLAAAALEGAAPLDVAAAWRLDAGTMVEPSPAVDGEAIQAAIAAARLRPHTD